MPKISGNVRGDGPQILEGDDDGGLVQSGDVIAGAQFSSGAKPVLLLIVPTHVI